MPGSKAPLDKGRRALIPPALVMDNLLCNCKSFLGTQVSQGTRKSLGLGHKEAF